jgi:drug/metabolite transporter (DMT)-like permease
MKRSDSCCLVLLAALWGGSYLFMRLGAAEFGAVPLAAVRAGAAAVLLLAFALARGELRALTEHGVAIAIVGLLNSAAPFVLVAFAAQRLPAGLLSVLTAMTPLFTLAVAAGWGGERIDGRRIGGFVAGIAGVGLVVAGERPIGTAGQTDALAIGACLLATLLYGISANFTRRRLAAAPAVTVAAGSQLAAAVVLAIPAMSSWPDAGPPARAWWAVLGLAVLSTALAYGLFFRLIARIGAPRTMTVTFLIPVFGVLWGGLFLGEPVTLSMVVGGAVILLGTAWATGMWRTGGRGWSFPAAGRLALLVERR